MYLKTKEDIYALAENADSGMYDDYCALYDERTNKNVAVRLKSVDWFFQEDGWLICEDIGWTVTIIDVAYTDDVELEAGQALLSVEDIHKDNFIDRT